MICRLCLSEESLEDIFKSENLSVWILDFLSIVVSKDDQISVSICSDCRKRLQEFRDYQLRCLEVQDVLLRKSLAVEKPDIALQDVPVEQATIAVGDEPVVGERFRLAGKLSKYKNYKKVKCTICAKPVLTYFMEGHLNRHQGLRPFKCERGCENANFNCRYGRQNHYRNLHDGKLHECDVCHKTFRNRGCLYYHIQSVHSAKTFVCSICNKGFGTSSRLMVHKKKHDIRVRKYPCSMCSLSFFTNRIREGHMKTHRRKNLRDQTTECVDGEQAVLESNGIQSGTTSVSGEDKVEPHKDEEKQLCSLCDKIFPAERMEGHQNWHQGLRPFVCERGCEALDFHCRQKRLQHYRRVHDRFECEICYSIFRSKKTLRRHKLGVHAPKSFNCSTCNSKFTTSERLKLHTKLVHDREKNHKCPKCSKAYCFKYELNRHLKSQKHSEESEDVVLVKMEPGAEAEESEEGVEEAKNESEQPDKIRKTIEELECPKCDRILLEKDMEAHLNWHSDLWPYKCERGCEDQCFRSDKLRQKHYRTVHDKCLCDICHKRLSSMQRLSHHKISVHGEKAFACFCGKSFTLKYRLTRHMGQVHKDQTYQSCPICSNVFASTQDMDKHMEMHDSSQLNEKPLELEDLFEPGEVKIEPREDDDDEPIAAEIHQINPAAPNAESIGS